MTPTFEIVPTINATLYTYDAVGRTTEVDTPDPMAGLAITRTTYSIATPQSGQSLGSGQVSLLTTVQDANGHVRYSHADPRGNRIAVQEQNQIGTSTSLTTLTTLYGYDPIDELTSVKDASGNVTSAAYDSVGDMILLTSPDAGVTEYRYDLAGNMAFKAPASLRAQGTNVGIVYGYNHDRLETITYPSSPKVTYVYGGSTETGDANGNVAGRIKQVLFDGGNETRKYDHLGNVSQTQTTLPNMSSTTPASVTFPMSYTYDWLGRMQTMTFPNWVDHGFKFIAGPGELVTYTYDHGGNLDKITGKDQTPNPSQTSAPLNFTYLTHIGYNEFEQRTVFTAGNGIATTYGYDADTRRLTDINASARGQQEVFLGKPATPFNRIHYTYDLVGNITHMVNNVSVQPWKNAPVMVGPMDVSYTYDNLYQLRSMTGKYRPMVDHGFQYSDVYTYDAIGNMLTKAQSQDRLVWDNQTVNTSDPNPVVTQLAGSRFDHNVAQLTYNLGYQYTTGRPHAATPVTETPAGHSAVSRVYTYDANGNNTGNALDSGRIQKWDEENRLKEVDKSTGVIAKFKYNDQGERTKKQVGTNDTWYVNQYYAIFPGDPPMTTKHIFAGETRLATKNDQITMQTPTLTWYHSDNLGTTGYTSDQTQTLQQHERYFAFGELWRGGSDQDENNMSSNLTRNWLFTSKEWDADESLYYFGARYFDPHADVWQSTDPMLVGYVKQGAAGTSPANLGLYTYAWNNPVVLRDSTGLCTDTGAPGLCDPEQVAIQRRDTAARDAGSSASSPGGGAGVPTASFVAASRVGATDTAVTTAAETEAAADVAVATSAGPLVLLFPFLIPGDTAPRKRKEPDVFRSMKVGPNGQPLAEPTARGLGVRPGEDLPVSGGIVKPGTGGMSVALGAPINLQPFRRPAEFGGTGKDPVWAIDPTVLGLQLRLIPDSPVHGTVQPASEMSLEAYQAALAATAPLWRVVPGK